MDDNFIVTPKTDKTVTMTIRVDESIQKQFDALSKQSNRSRNELINIALEYALQNVKFVNDLNEPAT
jgi:predicted transcriptional regulator